MVKSWRRGNDPMSLRGAKWLAGASGAGFLVGLYFPLMVLLAPGPSAMAYGIVLVSLPVWAVGSLSGGLAGYLASRTGRAASQLQRCSWLISSLNLSAFLICLIWAPPGIS